MRRILQAAPMSAICIILDAVGKYRITRALEKVELDAFPLRDWNDALEYITGAKMPCSSAEQSKAVLIAALSS